MSALPWRKQFYDILRYIATAPATKIAGVLQLLKKSRIPSASLPLAIVPNRIELKPPVSTSTMPSMAMMILRSALTARLLTEVWCALLWERRVILKSKSLATLTDVTAAIEELLYPFKWQSIYIIPMPMEMIDYCHAPTPYLIGVHSSLYQRLIEDVGQTMVQEGISILDIDNQAFYSNDKTADLDLIPKRILKELEESLKGWNTFSGMEIKQTFLTAQARLLENYKCGLYIKNDSSGVDFDKDKFIAAHEDPLHRRFAEQIVTVQMFEQFTQTKCHQINEKASASAMDVFELRLKTLPELKGKMTDVKLMAKSGQHLFTKMVDKGKTMINEQQQQRNSATVARRASDNRSNYAANRSVTTDDISTQRPRSVFIARELTWDSPINSPSDIAKPVTRDRPSHVPPQPPAPSIPVTPQAALPSTLIDLNPLTISSSSAIQSPTSWIHSNIQKPSADKSGSSNLLSEFDPLS